MLLLLIIGQGQKLKNLYECFGKVLLLVLLSFFVFFFVVVFFCLLQNLGMETGSVLLCII